MTDQLHMYGGLIAISTLFATTHAQNSDAAGQTNSIDNNAILRDVHSIIACIAWVILFPVGAVLLRLIKSETAWWIHASIQSTATILVVISAATGIALADREGEMGVYHAIIGLVLFGVVFVQITGGAVHHIFYRKYSRRTVTSHLHIWLGRTMITLGMVNGGLGLQLSGEGSGKIVAYSVVAGLVWIACAICAILDSRKRARSTTVVEK